MYSNYDPYYSASRREAMAAARKAKQEPQAIAAVLPVNHSLIFISSLLSIILNPLLIISLLGIVGLALILLGL